VVSWRKGLLLKWGIGMEVIVMCIKTQRNCEVGQADIPL
jgi:hypothetical protein